MKEEVDKLEMGIRRYAGDDLSSLTLSDINDLEQHLEFSVNKVRTRKVLTVLPVYFTLLILLAVQLQPDELISAIMCFAA
jgi:hypothetical protein